MFVCKLIRLHGYILLHFVLFVNMRLHTTLGVKEKKEGIFKVIKRYRRRKGISRLVLSVGFILASLGVNLIGLVGRIC